MLRILGGLALIAALLPTRLPAATPHRAERERADLDTRIPLGEMLVRHRTNVKLLITEGQLLPAVFDGEEFLATERRYNRHPRLRIQYASAMSALLLAQLTMLAPVPAIFFYRLGARHPLPWTVLLAEGLVGLYLRYGCSSAKVVNILRRFTRERPHS
jgi:hypothetical protein